MKKLFLIDAYAMIYKAHFAMSKRPLINSKGVNVSPISGFMSMILDLLNNQSPTHLIVGFDLDTPTFRNDIFAEYKAGRDAQPEDIRYAIPIIRQILSNFPIASASCEGYEADDVIGTLAQKAEAQGFEVYMMTPDKDYAQLVTEKIHLYRPAHFGNEIRTLSKADILEDWGIKYPSQVIDFLALQGDAVDNIPGVKGIGEKTATTLLKDWESVENIYENLDKIAPKTRALLEASRPNAFLSKQLATIETNVPIEFVPEDCELGNINKQAVLDIFKQLEFKSLSERFLKYCQKIDKENSSVSPNPDQVQTDLFGNVVESAASAQKADAQPAFSIQRASKNISNTPHTYKVAATESEISELVGLLSAQKRYCFDTETTGLDTYTAELVGMSWAWEAGVAYYVPVPKEKAAAQALVERFKPVLENPAIEKIGQNLKFDISILANYGVQVAGQFWDTMLIHYILEPEKRHGMDYLSETYLDYSPVSIETLIGKKGKNQLTMRDIALDKISEYAAEDADITYQLFLHLEPLLKDAQRSLYLEIEAPMIRVLADMERVGVRVDRQFLADYQQVLGKELKTMETSIYEQAGVRFNLNSPAQVGQVLFEKLQIPYRWKKTSKTNQFSTDEEKLAELSDEYQIVRDMLEYRKLAKLQSTYIEALPLLINPQTGNVHSSFNQALTATGRLSSQNPNLQNIPIRSEKGKEIRKAFVATDPANRVILAADYSQIELRLIAAMSGESAMLEAFREGIDIHTATASKIYNIPVSEVSKTQRYAAKTVNFSIIYGAGATNLSRQLGIKRADAVQLIAEYYKQYAGLDAYMQKVLEQARQDNFVTTLCGRRRYLRDLNSQNSLSRSQAERNAINSPIQGTAADFIKIAMIRVHAALMEHKLDTKLILQVHDELLFDVPKSELEQVKTLVRACMQDVYPSLGVPLLVELGVGGNWLEAH